MDHSACRDCNYDNLQAVGKHLADWAALPPERSPTGREPSGDVSGMLPAACGGALGAKSSSRRAGGGPAAAGVRDRVVGTAFPRSAPGRTEAELWRPAWGLMPAFGAVVVALADPFHST